MRLTRVAVWILFVTSVAIPAWAATNQTISVTAKTQDNPQQNPDDVEGHFTQSPTGDKDEIHVTNENVKGKKADVYNDPINDGALLTITQEQSPVKVAVEGRQGIGAIYWVTVLPTGGEGGGGGGGQTVLWADVEDVDAVGALVLKDTNSGLGAQDTTDSDTDTPKLHCITGTNGKGDVEFWIVTESGAYPWSIKQDTTTIASGTLDSNNDWTDSKTDLTAGWYKLEVTKQDDQNFKRRVDFAVMKVEIDSISPDPFCPGAGTNLTVNYTVSPTTGFTVDSAELSIRDFSNIMRTDSTIDRAGGCHTASWDGKDSDGNYAMPGQGFLEARVTIEKGGVTTYDYAHFDLKMYEIKLETVTRTIESANNYSENVLVKATVIFPEGTAKAGETVTFYDTYSPYTDGKITFKEESGTTHYDGNNGATQLPGDDTVYGNGKCQIMLKSVSGAKTAFLTPPDDALITTANADAVENAATNPLEIEQWFDRPGTTQNRVDWCEEWTDDLLSAYQNAGGEVGFVTSQCAGIGEDFYNDQVYGRTYTDHYTIYINPAAPDHRLNTDSELENTVLHECRHTFQSYESNRDPAGAVDNDSDLSEDPDNDDDPTLYGDGDFLPELVMFASEQNQNDGIQDGVAVGRGDGTKDDYDTIVEPALEDDAFWFAAAHD